MADRTPAQIGKANREAGKRAERKVAQYHADALADLIDAARLFVDPATPHEATCYSREAAMRAPRECPCDCGLDDLRDALAALEADR